MGSLHAPVQTMEAPGTWSCQLTAAPGHQCDSALVCSSAPHPSDPQPPTLTTKRQKTDIPTLLSADILALRLQAGIADPILWNVSRAGRTLFPRKQTQIEK